MRESSPDSRWRIYLINSITVLTFLNAIFWLALIYVARYTAPESGFTFMFQFLHFTSYIVNAGGLGTIIRILVTVLFLLIDTSALLWRLVDPVLAPWSAFHLLATINSAIFLALGLAQAFVFWMPFALDVFQRRRSVRSILN